MTKNRAVNAGADTGISADTSTGTRAEADAVAESGTSGRKLSRSWLAGYLVFLSAVAMSGMPLFTRVNTRAESIVGIIVMVAVLSLLVAGAGYLEKRCGSPEPKFLERRFFAYNVLFAIVYLPGRIWFEHEVAWWLAGGILASLPWWQGAYAVLRRADSRALSPGGRAGAGS